MHAAQFVARMRHLNGEVHDGFFSLRDAFEFLLYRRNQILQARFAPQQLIAFLRHFLIYQVSLIPQLAQFLFILYEPFMGLGDLRL